MKKTELKCNYPIRLKNNSVSNTNKNQIMKSKFNINRPNNKQGYLTQLITPDPYYRRVPKDRTQARQTKLRQKYGLSKNNDRVVREHARVVVLAVDERARRRHDEAARARRVALAVLDLRHDDARRGPRAYAQWPHGCMDWLRRARAPPTCVG